MQSAWGATFASADRAATQPHLAGVLSVLGDASLLLLVGGIAMLVVIVVLVVLQGLFPDHSPAPGLSHRSRIRTLRPLTGWPAPRAGPPPRFRPGHTPTTLPIDWSLSRAIDAGLGEPRLLRYRVGYAQVRLYGCATCAESDPKTASRNAACAPERTLLQDIVRDVYGHGAVVRETSCARRGQPHCEFEVTYS